MIPLAAGFPGGAVVKNPLASAGDMGLIPGSGRSPGGGKANLFQYSCIENSMDRGARWATVYRVAESWTWLNDWTQYNNKLWQRREWTLALHSAFLLTLVCVHICVSVHCKLLLCSRPYSYLAFNLLLQPPCFLAVGSFGMKWEIVAVQVLMYLFMFYSSVSLYLYVNIFSVLLCN